MSKYIGVKSTGIKLPILKEGDDLASEVVTAVLKATKKEHLKLQDHDIIAITESIVARTAGDYITTSDIADDIRSKIGKNKTIGLVFPILSRNRFSNILKGIAQGVKKIYLVLSYPCDEVGNHLVSDQEFYNSNISSVSVLSESEFRKAFGETKHEFTGVDYVEYYKEIASSVGCDLKVIFSNDPTAVLEYTKTVIAADTHTRFITKARLLQAGAQQVLLLTDICNKPNSYDKSRRYNSQYGLLGTNKVSDTVLKLFPEHGNELVTAVQAAIQKMTGKHVEVMVYGDGAFKDPQGKIWELADPVVSPFYTSGLNGTPNEIKLKYFADNKFKDIHGKELESAIKEEITKKDKDLVGNMASEGTTPRKITDLLGSLADLTSGSGDRGTPVVLIQNYFSNYSN